MVVGWRIVVLFGVCCLQIFENQIDYFYLGCCFLLGIFEGIKNFD
jgi:hypothetical protein